MKKTILMILTVLLFSITSIKAYNPWTSNITINNSISNVTIDFPATIKVLKSDTDKSYIRIRTNSYWLLKGIEYKNEKDRFVLKSTLDMDSFKDSNIIIYLVTPADEIDFDTTKQNLFVSVEEKYKYLTNNENKN